MRILITGASGLVGFAVAQAAKRRGHEAIGCVRSFEGKIPGLAEQLGLDLRNETELERWVLDRFPDAIVNCAAVSEAGDCERLGDAAAQLNVGLPRKLALLASHLFARLIHLSSEQVFDGETPPYRIDSRTHPVNEYGRQKLESEKAALESGSENAIILRLPLLNGNSPSGRRSLHERLLRAWSRKEPTPLFEDEWRQPCLADSVAEAIVELCERDDLHGILHWAGRDRLSRLEMGQRLALHFGLEDAPIVPAARGTDPRFAHRQRDLALDLQPLAGMLKTRPQPFSEQLEALVIPKDLQAWYNGLP